VPILKRIFFACMVANAGLLAAPHAVNAKTIYFDFSNVTQGSGTPFSETVDGLTAKITGSGDPGGVQLGSSFFNTIPGNIIFSPGLSGQENQVITVSFSSAVTDFSAPFATIGIGQLTLTAYSGSSVVGSISVAGTLGLDSAPVGTIQFGGLTFDSVVLSDSQDPDFAIGGISVASPVPEPETYSTCLIGIGLMACVLRRRTSV
jgi:PEP-CTERM motif